MKKIFLMLALCILLSIGQITSTASDITSVTAVDGKVTVSASVAAAEDTPVLIFVLPAIFEDGNDVTAARVQELNTTTMLNSLKVEYVALEYVASGKITHNCVMKHSLPTGLCHVVFSYLGSENCYSVGTFEHVGEDDKTNLLTALNAANKDTCGSVIYDDMNGALDEDAVTRLVPKEILRKSSADVGYYNTLGEEKAQFHEILYNLKGEQSFDLSLLVDSFNKAGIWMRLRLESDTLNVLNTYNGEGIGKYWNIEIGDDSDFVSLSQDEKASILGKMKTSNYEDKTILENDFRNGVIMAMFRSVTTREELEELISSDGNYAAEFAEARKIISDAGLNEYNKALLYNDVLEKNSNCRTLDDIKNLFASSVPEIGGGSSSGGSGGSSGGGKLVGSNSDKAMQHKDETIILQEQFDVNPFPFTDVKATHWAYSYVRRLYENKVINGISSDEFAPDAGVERQDFVKILVGALGMENSKTASQFNDVKDGSYYAPFVMTAYEKGIITGMGENLFGVGVSIKREDVAVIIDRVLLLYGAEKAKNEVNFADIDTASEYAIDAISNVSAVGVFSGDENGNFNPKAALTRAEACAILSRLAEIIKEV